MTLKDTSHTKFEEKTCGLRFGKWQEDSAKFSPVHTKIGTFIGSFYTKFKGKLTCASKNNMRNLATFHQSTWKSQNWDLGASFCLNSKIYQLKIYRGVVCHDNEEWCKSWEGIDLSVQNWHEKFDEFWPEHSKI